MASSFRALTGIFDAIPRPLRGMMLTLVATVLGITMNVTVRQIGILIVLGGLAGFIQLCIAQAFRDADATLVLPVDFTKLIWAGIAGYLVFSEISDIWTRIGAIVVFLGVFYMALQGRKDFGQERTNDNERDERPQNMARLHPERTRLQL